MLVTVTVLAAQAYSLTRQDEAYSFLKPDYKGALKHLTVAEGMAGPFTSTALWELKNLSRYYADRREIPEMRIVTRAEAVKEDAVIVLVPEAYPLEAAHLAELRDFVRSGTTRTLLRCSDGPTAVSPSRITRRVIPRKHFIAVRQ